MSAINTNHASLEGKVAIITGGSSGIGLNTAFLLHSLGAKVVIGDLSPPKVSMPAGIAFVKLNVTKYAELVAAWKFTKKHFGSYPTICIANAGIAEKGRLYGGAMDDIETEPDYSVIDIDATAVASTVRLGWWGIKQEKKEGSIIVTASMAGYAGQAGLPIYNGAKHFCVGLVRSLRYLAPSHGIAVSLVAPAITNTPLLASPLPYAPSSSAMSSGGLSASVAPAPDSPEVIAKAFKAAGVPVNTPDDIAHVFVNLIQEGKKANGKGILVQGGKCADLERGIAATRAAWMGEEMLQLYKGGSGEQGVGIGQGVGEPKSKL